MFFVTKRIFVQGIFLLKRLEQKRVLGAKEFLGPENFLAPENFLGPTKYWSKFQSLKIWSQKKWSKKIF